MKLVHVISAEPLPGHRLRVAFDDGAEGLVDLEDELWGPVFEPLRDPAQFARVRVDAEWGTVTWPTGADLDPGVLRARLRRVEQ